MVDDVHGYTCVVIGWESGDKAIYVGKMSFVMGEDWWRCLHTEVCR